MSTTPSERFKPDLIRYWNQVGNSFQWFAVYGDLIGAGSTPATAMANFDVAFEGGPMEAFPQSTIDAVRSTARTRRKNG